MVAPPGAKQTTILNHFVAKPRSSSQEVVAAALQDGPLNLVVKKEVDKKNIYFSRIGNCILCRGGGPFNINCFKKLPEKVAWMSAVQGVNIVILIHQDPTVYK